MSLKSPNSFDIAIVGGGFSALAALAHLVRFAEKPFSVCVIASDGFENFGPAYATPRDEHLLNVRTTQMGLYEGDTTAFHAFAEQGGPDDYLPRNLFARFLKSCLQQVREEAATKNITVTTIKGIVDDIDDNAGFTLSHDGQKTAARYVLLATGNSFPSVYNDSKRIIENVWHYDFAKLPSPQENIAIIGSGLTAVDVIISLNKAGWQGKTICYSGNGNFPRRHPVVFEKEKIPVLDINDFKSKRLSALMHEIRKQGVKHGAYAFYALRPFVQEIWKSLSMDDKKRAMTRYLWVWNIHRHRYAAYLDDIVQTKIKSGALLLKKGKVKTAEETAESVALHVNGRRETFALAFRCTGPSYNPETKDLIGTLVKKGLVKAHETKCGLSIAEDLSAGKNIYAIGPLLFGEFLEATAVPEIRTAAAKLARTLLSRL